MVCQIHRIYKSKVQRVPAPYKYLVHGKLSDSFTPSPAETAASVLSVSILFHLFACNFLNQLHFYMLHCIMSV